VTAAPPVIVCDLDGVIWLADTPIAGAADAIATLRGRGHRVLFATNNSAARVSEVEDKLARFDIPARGDVVTSAIAGALVVPTGARALVAGGPGIVEELARRDVDVSLADVDHDHARFDAVVVGFHRWFDYEVMRRCATAVRAGAQLVGTNDDPTYPTPDGPIPGGGSILAAVALASGVSPLVAGKPFAPMADVVRAMVSDADIVMVGDRPSTDGDFAVQLGARFALVMSGVTGPEHLPVSPDPWWIGPSIASLPTALELAA
jgi:HAD superfamily hydrolase (TIGR01450 family)